MFTFKILIPLTLSAKQQSIQFQETEMDCNKNPRKLKNKNEIMQCFTGVYK